MEAVESAIDWRRPIKAASVQAGHGRSRGAVAVTVAE